MNFYEPNIFIAIVCTFLCVITSFLLLKLFKINIIHVKHGTIDGLRGYLAFFVFLHHSCIYYYLFPSYDWKLPPQNLFIHFGQTSVSLFFMITGFLFFDKLIEHKLNKTKINWCSYYVSRLLRLYPLYIFCLIIMLFIVMIKSNFTLFVDIPTIFSQIKDWVFFSIFKKPAINNFTEVENLTCGVLWSMKYECIFYLLFPIISMIVLKQRLSILIIVLSLKVIYMMCVSQYTDLILFNSFIYGFIAALLIRNTKIKRILSGNFFSCIAVLLIIFLVKNYSTIHNLVPQLIIGIIFIIIASGNSLFGLLLSKSSKILGQLTYSIYLIHGIILFVILRLIMGDTNVYKLSFIKYWIMIALIGVLVIIVSFFTHYFIELPAMKLSAKFSFKMNRIVHSVLAIFKK